MEFTVDDDSNIIKLPVKKKEQDERYLKNVVVGDCFHRSGFTIDETLENVTCNACGEKLNPMWVIRQLASEENRWHSARQRYQDEMKRLKERSRTKCRHCGEMTPISRR